MHTTYHTVPVPPVVHGTALADQQKPPSRPFQFFSRETALPNLFLLVVVAVVAGAVVFLIRRNSS
jgi:hypothetical protein